MMDYGRVKIGMYDDPRKLQNEDELLIFGYSCKLFRDDEKALSLENGEHLIPWMADSTLLIDRFDVRGALYDLSEAEARGRPLEEVFTEAELKEEEICDQERYFALYHDEIQYQLAYEEEAKRLQVELATDGSVYNQVSFSYTPPEVGETEIKEEPQLQPVIAEPITYNPSSDEDLFIPPPELNIPPGIEVPKTVKQNKIIIKTAKFVVSQGAQMEIIIKTKQAGNVMFNFLAFDNALNAYYKLVVSLIRNGRYRWEEDLESTPRERSEQYLHPNLSQSHPRPPPDLTPGVTSSPARPSPHCAYSKLITKIREKQKATSSTPIEDTELPSSSSPVLPSSPLHATPSSVSGVAQDLRPTPTTVGLSPSGPITGLVDYPSFNPTADGNSDGEDSEPRKATRGPLRDYRHIKWPPPDLQMVIDKMASYIIKNGVAFEEVVKSRGDTRFDFLNKSHEYHPYYKCKMQLYNEVYGDIFKTTTKVHHDWRKKTQGEDGNDGGEVGGGINGGSSSSSKKSSSSSSSSSEHAKNSASRTISFSIKSREQEVSLTSRTTFPIESSTSEEDEELEEDERERRRAERAQRRQARRHREEREKREREELLKKERMKREKEEAEERKEARKTADEDSSGNEDLYDIFKYAQEMEQETIPSCMQQQTQQQTQLESPDEASSKQEERKKKAAAFLSKLKGTKEDKKMPIYGPQIPPDIAAGLLLRSATQSPSSSRESVERDRVPPPLPLPPAEPPHQPPPPLPKSPSPPLDIVDNFCYDKRKAPPLPPPPPSYGRELSSSPKRSSKAHHENSTSMASVLCGLNEAYGKQGSERVSELPETQNRKSRSHKKHSRQKSESRSPSGRRERKKRKQSRGGPSHRRKKRRTRSRSRSRSRVYAKSHRTSHKKKQSKHHSSHRDKEKTRKKKHKKHRSPSLVSSLPSSESSSPSTPSTLPSESETDIQVIESDEGKRSSRGSSIVSLPSTLSVSRFADSKKISSEVTAEVKEVAKTAATADGSVSRGENSSVATAPFALQHAHTTQKYSRTFLSAIENSNSSDGPTQTLERKPLFNPNASSAMAKIAQGLRAKLNAMLEKEKKLE